MRGKLQSDMNSQSPEQKQTTKMINDNQKGEMIRHFMSQVNAEDLLNVGFMKPIEVALRTNREDKTVSPDSLPQGLMQAIKSNFNDNKYQLKKMRAIEPFINQKGKKQDIVNLQDLKLNHLDNFISLLKKPEAPANPDIQEDQLKQQQIEPEIKPNDQFELGICVSMCGQDKKILKRTLTGVANNVDQLVRSGVSPDDIFVVVVIDGVQKVDKSLYEYFQQFERESQSYLQEDDKLTLKKKYQNYQYHQEVDKEQPLNFSKFLFKSEQFCNRIESKFQNVREKYDEVLRIKKSIQNIKKDKNKDNDNLKMILNRMIDKQKGILKNINGGKDDPKVLINEQSIMKELANSQEQCNQYITTRDKLAYVNAYRLPTSSLSADCKDRETVNTIERSSIIQGQFQTQRMFDEQLMDKRKMDESVRLSGNKQVKKSIRYVNLFFCIKYKQSGKLSSHNWFFNGFCQQLRPKYAILLDVGVRPYPDAIFKMYRYMKLNEHVGSVCGYLRLIQQKVEDQEMTKSEDMDCISSILINFFDIQRAQQLQYHFQNLIDKPFESLFRFIHVLPGSFSGYNMSALRPTNSKDGLLRQYFRSIDQKLATNKVVPSTFTAGEIMLRVFFPKTIWQCFSKINPDSQEQMLYNENIYLAQDRILCLGIHKNDKDIIFMPDVYAQVEPIKMINDLMGQRKKDLNGGLYSFQKVSKQIGDKHSKSTNFFLKFQLMYLSFTKFLAYFAPALLLFTFHFTMQTIQVDYLHDLLATESRTGIGAVIYATFTNIIDFIYALMILAIFFFSLHLRHDNKRYVYFIYLISSLFGIFTILTFFIFIADIVKSFTGAANYLRKSYEIQLDLIFPGYGLLLANLLRYSILSSLSVIIIPIITYTLFFRKLGIVWDIFVGSLSFLFYSPTYLNILHIYSKCRVDDISSGSKQNTSGRNAKMKESWNTLKMIDVGKYMMWNTFLGVTLILLHGYLLIKFFALLFILSMFTLVQSVKVFLGIIYIIKYKCTMISNPIIPSKKEIQDNMRVMEFRIFRHIKQFQSELRIQIQDSFKLAAEQSQYRQYELNLKKEAKMQQKNIAKVQPKTGNIPQMRGNESVQFRPSRQSIKLIQAFKDNRFQNLRESTAPKNNNFPFQFGGKKQAKPVAQMNSPLQLVLLKQQIGSQALNNKELKNDLKIGQQKIKRYQNFRTTMRPMQL